MGTGVAKDMGLMIPLIRCACASLEVRKVCVMDEGGFNKYSRRIQTPGIAIQKMWVHGSYENEDER